MLAKGEHFYANIEHLKFKEPSSNMIYITSITPNVGFLGDPAFFQILEFFS